MENREILIALYEKREELQKKLKAIDNAIIGFGGHLKEPTTFVNENLEGYSINFKWADKIKFVLEKYGPMRSKGIKSKLLSIDHTLEKDKTEKAVSLYVSRMHREGELDANKDDKAYIYSIKK